MEYDQMFKGFTDVMVIHIGKECEQIKKYRTSPTNCPVYFDRCVCTQ